MSCADCTTHSEQVIFISAAENAVHHLPAVGVHHNGPLRTIRRGQTVGCDDRVGPSPEVTKLRFLEWS